MSGPLRRLAAELAGATPQRIRAISRLPYMPAPELLPVDIENPSAPAGPPPLAPQTLQPPGVAPPIGDNPASRSPVPPTTDRPSDDTRPQVTVGTADDYATASSASSPATSAYRGDTRDSAAAAAHEPTAPGAAAWPQPVMPPVSPAERGHTIQDQALPLHRPDTADEESFPPPQPIIAGMVAPRPPAGIDPARVEQVRPRGYPLRRDTPPASVDSEVHVHIGRIEVTAVRDHPPSPQKSTRGSGRKPMSLDEYLARRQRDR